MTNMISKQDSIQAWIICITAALFFAYVYFQLNMLNAISSQFMLEFSINQIKFGLFSALYFYANAICLLPAGILLDRYATKKIIILAMSFCILSTAIMALTHQLLLVNISRFIMGLFNPFAFLACAKLIAYWFSSKRIALATGLTVTIGTFGGLIAQSPFAMLVNLAGWRQALWVSMGVGLIILLLLIFIIRDYNSPAANTVEKKKATVPIFKQLKSVVSQYFNWALGIYGGVMNLSLSLLGALWGSIYLTKAYMLTTKQAFLISSTLFLGIMVGSPLFGLFSDSIGKRVLPMLLATIALFAVTLIIIVVPCMPFAVLWGFFLSIGFLAGSQTVSTSYLIEKNGPENSSTAIGFMTIINTLLTAVAQPLFGSLMNDAISPAPTISIRWVLGILPIAAVFSFIALLKLKESKKLTAVAKIN